MRHNQNTTLHITNKMSINIDYKNSVYTTQHHCKSVTLPRHYVCFCLKQFIRKAFLVYCVPCKRCSIPCPCQFLVHVISLSVSTPCPCQLLVHTKFLVYVTFLPPFMSNPLSILILFPLVYLLVPSNYL